MDTEEDVRDRNLTVVTYPGSESIVEMLKNSSSPVTRSLAEMTFVPRVIVIMGLYYNQNFSKRIGTIMMRKLKKMW